MLTSELKAVEEVCTIRHSHGGGLHLSKLQNINHIYIYMFSITEDATDLYNTDRLS